MFFKRCPRCHAPLKPDYVSLAFGFEKRNDFECPRCSIGFKRSKFKYLYNFICCLIGSTVGVFFAHLKIPVLWEDILFGIFILLILIVVVGFLLPIWMPMSWFELREKPAEPVSSQTP